MLTKWISSTVIRLSKKVECVSNQSFIFLKILPIVIVDDLNKIFFQILVLFYLKNLADGIIIKKELDKLFYSTNWKL